MKMILTLLMLVPTAMATGQQEQAPDQNRLFAVLLATDAYLLPQSDGTAALSLFGGSSLVGIGTAGGLTSPGQQPPGGDRLALSSLVLGSSLIGVAAVAGWRKSAQRNAKEREATYLSSAPYIQLKEQIGEDQAKDFYQDLRSGVGIHHLVKTYASGPAATQFLEFFRQERQQVAEAIPQDFAERQARLDLIDAIASRRAALRVRAQEVGGQESARILEALTRDLERIRAGAVPVSPPSSQGPGSDPAPASTHD